jgi:hypothetical protein
MMLKSAGRALALAATMALLGGLPDAAVAADPVPSFDSSTLTCEPANHRSTRPGDDVFCRLLVRVTGAWSAATADITVPPNTTFDPNVIDNQAGTPDDPLNATKVTYDALDIGFMSPGSPKEAHIQFRIRPDVAVGDPIVPVATIYSPDTPPTMVTAKPVLVMPPPPDLKPSSLTCADAGPPPLLAGDELECSAQLANLPGLEDAANVTMYTSLNGALSWAPGGNESSHLGFTTVWDLGSVPGGVPSGGSASRVLTYHTRISPTTAAGSGIVTTAFVDFLGAQSSEPGTQTLASPALVVAPGPAVLTSSKLVCSDQSGPPLFPGDKITCTLTAFDLPGHEDVEDLAATAPVPDRTTADAAGADGLVPLSFGSLASGATKAKVYELKVAPDAPAGSTITGTAHLAGRSVPSSSPVSHDLTAVPLVVALPPAAPAALTPASVAAAAATPGSAPAKAPVDSRICGSRRVVVVNVRPPKGRHWKSMTMAFAKKKVKAKRATKGTFKKKGYFTARLVFQGLPKGPIKIAITGKTTRGKTVKRSRTYRLCTKRGAK